MILPHISEITGHEISSAITKGALQREDVISFSCLLVLCHYFRLAGRRYENACNDLKKTIYFALRQLLQAVFLLHKGLEYRASKGTLSMWISVVHMNAISILESIT